MTQDTTPVAVEAQKEAKRSRLTRFYIQSGPLAAWTLVFSVLGAVLYALVLLIPMPYTMVSLFKLGLVPAYAIIAVTGAIRGPIAGFLTGYLGTIVHDLLVSGVVVAMTLNAAAWGMIGFIVGLASYDFMRGRSLAKLSVVSAVGIAVTIMLLALIALRVDVYATLALVVFTIIPLLTTGIPSVVLLAPLYARAWHSIVARFLPHALAQ